VADPINVVVTAGLSNYKLESKLIGLIDNPRIGKIFLVRKVALEGHDKIINITPSSKIFRWLPLFELWRLIALTRIGLAKDISAFIAIQLVIHGMQARLAGWITGTPAYLSVIGDDVHQHLVYSPWRSALRYVVKHMSGVTVMGNESKKIIMDTGINKSKITIIQNYQNTEKFAAAELEKRWDLIFIGDLIERKRVPDLLYALSAINSPLKLAIVGDGTEKENLNKLAVKLKIEHQIEFTGQVSNVEYYLNSSKIMVLPSQLEALPAVAVESMYCGIPSILTNICDIPTYFEHNKGCLLYEPGDVNALTERIKLFTSDEECYQKNARDCLKWAERHAVKWSREQQVLIWTKILATKLSLEQQLDS